MADNVGARKFPEAFAEELQDVTERRLARVEIEDPPDAAETGTEQEARRTAFRKEQAAAWQRLTALMQTRNRPAALPGEEEPESGKPGKRKAKEKTPVDAAGLVGLAFSGGGIRSATFNLGVVQALNDAGAFRKVDYLSTVSGGGYIGSCLSAYLSADGPAEFPFKHRLGQRENLAFVRLREFANYLAPRGMVDFLVFPALFVKGLFVNLLVVYPLLLGVAGLTVMAVAPQVLEATADKSPLRLLAPRPYTFTLLVAAIFGGLLLLSPFLQAAYRSFGLASWSNRIRLFRMLGMLILAAGIALAVEVQPLAIWWLTAKISAAPPPGPAGPQAPSLVMAYLWPVLEFLWSLVAALGLDQAALTLYRGALTPAGHALSAGFGSASQTSLLAPLAHGLTAFWNTIAHAPYGPLWEVAKQDLFQQVAAIVGAAGAVLGLAGKYLPLKSAQFEALRGKLVLAAIGLAGPLLLWAFYVVLCAVAIGQITWAGAMVDGVMPETAFHLWDSEVLMEFWGPMLAIGIYCLLFVDVNKTSLHIFYRDRLSRAYLFRPWHAAEPGWLRLAAQAVATRAAGLVHRARPAAAAHPVPEPEEAGATRPELAFEHADTLKLSALSPANGPFHLVNATLNLSRRSDGSLRGRSADFFTFSRRHVGGPATGYAPVTAVEDLDSHLTLGTAMAISGAAAAPNMGTATNPALVFALALFNVRLGYWLPNPRSVGVRLREREASATWITRLWFLYLPGPWYLIREATRMLSDRLVYVQLSDGGHLENMGLYELLRRHCKAIIVCDGEQDGAMNFSGLAQAIRLARIDMGIVVHIDLDALKPAGPDGKDADDTSRKASRHHCAFGTIDYGTDRATGRKMTGELLYIKSSVTGDEDRYITSYRAAHPDFPHETTADQFFDEAQFEAYRALGWHAVTCPAGPGKGEDAEPRSAEGLTVAQWLEAL